MLLTGLAAPSVSSPPAHPNDDAPGALPSLASALLQGNATLGQQVIDAATADSSASATSDDWSSLEGVVVTALPAAVLGLSIYLLCIELFEAAVALRRLHAHHSIDYPTLRRRLAVYWNSVRDRFGWLQYLSTLTSLVAAAILLQVRRKIGRDECGRGGTRGSRA